MVNNQCGYSPHYSVILHSVCVCVQWTLSIYCFINNFCFFQFQGAYWSMNQFSKLFNTSRLPAVDCDVLVENFKTIKQSESPVSSEIIVRCVFLLLLFINYLWEQNSYTQHTQTSSFSGALERAYIRDKGIR